MKKKISLFYSDVASSEKDYKKIKKKFFIVGIDENLSCYCRKK